MSLHCAYQNSEFQKCSEGPSDRMGKPKFRWTLSSGWVLRADGIFKVELVVHIYFTFAEFFSFAYRVNLDTLRSSPALG